MKRHIVIGLAVLTLILLIEGNASTLPTAQAKIIGDDAATTAALEQCGELYSQPGDDPGGLWAKMSDPASRVVHVTFLSVPEILGTGTRTHPLGNRESQIFWDHTHPVIKDGVRSGPCEVLRHELQHAQDIADDLPDVELNELCDEIPQAEWRAIAAQNAFRAAIGLSDMRKRYEGKEFKSPSFEECKKKKKPEKPKQNSVFGDPHIATTDHLFYDLQQVGEFTAFTSDTSDTPRVQVRTSPVGESSFASMVSGVAVGTADHRISFVQRGATITITAVTGSAHETVPIETGEHDLGAGVTLSATEADPGFTGSAYTLSWTDGSELYVDNKAHWGLRVSFEPSDKAKAAAPRGLLGTYNGIAADDLTRPDGRVVPSDAPAATVRFDFGDKWRTTQADSLFAYGPGESTDTFTDRTFPRDVPQFSTSLTAQARQVCLDAGITDEAILAACTFDVANTGNPALASVAAQVARDVKASATGTGPDSVSTGPGPLRDGSKVTGTITDPQQRKRYDLDLGDATYFWVGHWRGTTDRCDQTFTINFVDVSHNNFPCTGQDHGFRIPDDGQRHQLEIASPESGTGPFSFTVVTLKPRNLAIAAGATVSGEIDVAGREDRYELPIGLAQVQLTSTLDCNGDNINKGAGLYDLTEDRTVVGTRALCTRHLGPWKLPDPTHRYAIVVDNAGLNTGPYSFRVE